MAIHARRRPLVALIGNPNTGKTSLFNALTGFRRHAANYPGVTVETARGPVRGAARPMELLDLPGTYSLAAMSPDEMLVSNVLCGRLEGHERADAILAIVDASNLPRNLYLVSQLLDLELPMVVAVNMIDVARSRGIEVDCERLSRRLGVPAVPIVATQPSCPPPLLEALDRVVVGSTPAVGVRLPKALDDEVAALCAGQRDAPQRAEALRILLDQEGYAEKQFLARGGSPEELWQARARLEAAGIEGPRAEVQARYRWIHTILEGVITRPEIPIVTWSDRIDRILTHQVWGAVFLLAVLFVLFQAIFTWAGPLMQVVDWAFGTLAEVVAKVLPQGALQSLVTDGIIAGVGGVLAFLPQILILFAIIAILEDCGYMARAAYMNDRLMRALGLSGRAFIPLLSSFACAVPAIMGTRAIADRRERFVTILIAPFMSCAARLPVYVLLVAAFVPDNRYLGGWASLHGLVMLGMYLLGMVVAVPIAWLLRKTAFAGPSRGFLLELPSYKLPRLRAIWQRMYGAGREFAIRAGTIILAVNVVVWALGYFPRSATTRSAVERQAQAAGWDETTLESELAGAYLRESYLGRIGHAVEPVVKPIGWDWRIGMAVVASFPAREVVVASLGTIYNLGEQADEKSDSLRAAIKGATWPDTGEPVFTLPVALSIMVFFALCAQCVSTLVVIGRETGSWLWPVVSFVSMTTIAYLAAWGVSAAGQALGL
ncbi:MAG: ferrous iron transport protein B [Phycisphaerae bacterium]